MIATKGIGVDVQAEEERHSADTTFHSHMDRQFPSKGRYTSERAEGQSAPALEEDYPTYKREASD